MPHTVCVFNVNNLYVRYRFGKTFPGDFARKSAVNDPHCGYAPMYEPWAFELFSHEQRALAAQRDHRAERTATPTSSV